MNGVAVTLAWVVLLSCVSRSLVAVFLDDGFGGGRWKFMWAAQTSAMVAGSVLAALVLVGNYL